MCQTALLGSDPHLLQLQEIALSLFFLHCISEAIL
jgi:hypothetical protein